jgi:hypothetical protein
MELTNRSWPEIVAHIPRNLEGGQTLSTGRSPSHLEFMLSHIRFDWLRFGYVTAGSFSGLALLWSGLPNELSRGYSSRKSKTDMGSNIDRKQSCQCIRLRIVCYKLHTQVF